MLDGTWMANETNTLYLDCIHCGLCLSSCPTYRVLGAEMDSPRGRIYLMRALDEGRAKIADSFIEHMFRCLDWRAWETACPSGVHFGQMMEEMRGKIVEENPAHWFSRWMLQYVFPYPWRFQIASRLLELYRVSGIQAMIRETGLLRFLAPRMADAEELMPEIGIERGVTLDSFYRAEGRKQGTVAFFTGCVMNSMLGSINRSSIRLLNAAGYDVIVPGEQICCGALANHAGLRDTAKEMARKNIAAFPIEDLDAVIINAAGCGAMLKEYPLLIDGAERFSAKVKDIAEFLVSTRIFARLKLPLERRGGCCDSLPFFSRPKILNQARTLLKDHSGNSYLV